MLPSGIVLPFLLPSFSLLHALPEPPRSKYGRTNMQKNIRIGNFKLQMPREVGGSPSLEVFQSHGNVALRAVVSGHSGGGLRSDLRILVVFSSLNDSVIL